MSTTVDISYTPLEAAYYARLHPSTVRAWLSGRLHRSKTEGEINFYEFVQLLAVRELRNKGITLRTIRETIRFVQAHCGIEYPFASEKHQTFIEGKQLFIRIKGEAHSFSASGQHTGQLNIEPLVELYMTKLIFDKDGLARKFIAHDHVNEQITICPEERYGQPILASNQHNAFVLAQAVQTEGGFDQAAEVYGLTRNAMIAAVDYVDSLDLKSKQGKAA